MSSRKPARKTLPSRAAARKPVSTTPGWVMPAAVVGGLAVLVAAFWLIRWYTTPLPPPAPSQDTTAQVISTITSLPASEFDTVGQGSASNLIKPVSGTTATGATGKPLVLYIGAEYCPYCAAQRWPLIIALSRFGTFSGLKTTTSSSSDVYPNTVTFTFRGAAYTSQYIDFRGVETLDRDQNPLQTPSATDQDLMNRYDSGGTIPFIDFANHYAETGAFYSPETIGGMSWLALAQALQQPDSPQAKAIIGSANLITAAICKANSYQPASVCSTPSMQNIENGLK
jgi:thiol-disulfide isomerase/thioredoxin